MAVSKIKVVAWIVTIVISGLLVLRFFDHEKSGLSEISAHTAFNMSSLSENLDMYTKLMATFSPQALENILETKKDYLANAPFPHTFVDDLFPAEIIRAVNVEISDNPEFLNGCVKGSDSCFTKGTQLYKSSFTDEGRFGPATFAVFAFLKSSTFLKFLEKLTGIQDLIADPHYRGSGVHQTLPGGLLEIHADFNRYERYNLHRRVNVFIFLNDDWDDSYGGHLELWKKDMTSCGAKIRPLFGRFVVFSSTDFSYHGHPHPLTCPKNRSRRSLALYYYTRDRPASECLEKDCSLSHSTLFQTAKEACSLSPV